MASSKPGSGGRATARMFRDAVGGSSLSSREIADRLMTPESFAGRRGFTSGFTVSNTTYRVHRGQEIRAYLGDKIVGSFPLRRANLILASRG